MDQRIRFTKGHGTENDFLVLDDPDGMLELDAPAIAALTDRRRGIGGDGVIRAVRSRRARVDAAPDAPEWFMDYRNADGSPAEMCGNGLRVLAAHLRRAGHVTSSRFEVLTRAGTRPVEVLEEPARPGGAWSVRVGLGASRSTQGARTVEIAGLRLSACDVDMGNPHTVAFLPSGLALEELDLTHPPVLEPAPSGGTNIELVGERGPRHLAMRVHERGVGETRSCGTGVAAAAVAAALRARDDSRAPWTVDVPGGRLEVAWTAADEVTLTGPARLVADGTTLI